MSVEWGSKIWFSHGNTNARGVAILFEKGMDYMVHNTIISEEGRFILLYITMAKSKWLLVNVYAPNKDDPTFFDQLFKEVDRFTPNYVIIGCNMNFTFEPTFERYGSTANNDKSANWVANRIKNLHLTDVYRYTYPKLPGFTWHAPQDRQSFSCLDYFFISDEAMQFIEKIRICPSFKSDHSMIVLTLVLNIFPRGPSYRKLNTSFLKNGDYVSKMNNLIDMELESSKGNKAKNRWELLKLASRDSSLQLAKQKAHSSKNKIQVLENKLKCLQDELQNKDPLHFKDSGEQIRLIRNEMNEINKQKTWGAILRSRAKFAKLGKKATKYYLNMEKRNYQNKTIYRLKNEHDQIVTQENQILEVIQKYYETLYTSKVTPDLTYLGKLNILKIPENIHDELELPIQEEEIASALKNFPNNKCPGTDGLPPEFYKMFFPKIKHLLKDLFDEIVESGKFHLTARRAVLLLLEKSDKNELLIDSWRPLSLLNTENKIFAKILAKRIQCALDVVIHPSQTGFMKGRHLAKNILKIMEVVNYTDKNKINGLLVSFNFKKAFDTVEWESLFASLNAFGFGESFISMVKILFNEPLVTATNKKVLQRERKRHTACRVVSTPSVVLPGYPPSSRVPPHPDLTRYPPPRPGYTPPGGVPDQGTPPARVPPRGGT